MAGLVTEVPPAMNDDPLAASVERHISARGKQQTSSNYHVEAASTQPLARERPKH